MDITPLIQKGQKIIQAYKGGVFKISGQNYPHPVIVRADQVLQWDVHGGFEELKLIDFKSLMALRNDLDVVLLGCGGQMKFLPPLLKQALRQENLHIEVMDSGAACRTYNVLMAEGRRVAAALLLSE